MTLLRWTAFLSLNALAMLAALGVATRMRLRGRVEVVLAACLAWNFLVLVPTHALGLLHRLSPLPLGLASAVVSCATLVACLAPGDRAANLRELRGACVNSLRLPVDALVVCLRARSVAVVGVLAVAALLVWTAWQSWVFPSDGWDAIWYHDTMVGAAIQNHGYAPFALPMDLTQQANGYPRNCEMTSLWLVIFTDRRLIEIVNTVMAIPLIAATYVIARRFVSDRATAIGWATALLLVPGVALQLRTTYTDLHVAALLLGTLWIVTRPEARLRDGWFAALALALLAGSKSMALAWLPLLAPWAAGRVLAANVRARPAATLATVLGGACVVAGFGAVTYVANYVHFHNPIWPIAYDNARLHIHWPGVETLAATNVNRPFAEVLRAIVAEPTPGRDYADTRVFGYGFAVPLVLGPLACLGVVALLVTATATLARRLRGTSTARDAGTLAMMPIAVFVVHSAYFSPALWSARYNVQVIAGAFWGAAYLVETLGRVALGDALASFAVIANLASSSWLSPSVGGAGLRETLDASRRSDADRAAHAVAAWTIAPEVAAARERELGPGTVVVFSDDITFPSVLWNERFSNRVEYVPSTLGAEATRRRVDELGAKWIVTKERGGLAAVVRDGDWEEVGLASRGYPTKAFRRRSPR